MTNTQLIDLVAERAERLLLQHSELQRVNTLLQQQVQGLQQERDELKQHHALALQRLDALLARLPDSPENDA